MLMAVGRQSNLKMQKCINFFIVLNIRNLIGVKN